MRTYCSSKSHLIPGNTNFAVYNCRSLLQPTMKPACNYKRTLTFGPKSKAFLDVECGYGQREMDPRYLTFHIIFYNIFCFNGYLYEASDPRRLSDHSLLVRRVLLLLSEKSHFLLRVKSQLGWMMSLTIKG